MSDTVFWFVLGWLAVCCIIVLTIAVDEWCAGRIRKRAAKRKEK